MYSIHQRTINSIIKHFILSFYFLPFTIVIYTQMSNDFVWQIPPSLFRQALKMTDTGSSSIIVFDGVCGCNCDIIQQNRVRRNTVLASQAFRNLAWCLT